MAETKKAQKQTTTGIYDPEFVKKMRPILAWILVIGGVIGLVSAGALTLDEFQLAKNPAFVPNCNLNPIISCGSVMKSPQASVFGFPNPFIGLAAFPILITVGMALFAKADFKKWFWRGLQTGALLGVIFVHWLFFQTVYHINALCPWCMAVWVVTITTFWYTLIYNLAAKHIPLPKKSAAAIAKFLKRHHVDILILWFVILAALILQHFWYYYSSHLF
jgi:uncharacterized membrane protein